MIFNIGVAFAEEQYSYDRNTKKVFISITDRENVKGYLQED